MITIKVKTTKQEVEFTLEEAREVWENLNELFLCSFSEKTTKVPQPYIINCGVN